MNRGNSKPGPQLPEEDLQKKSQHNDGEIPTSSKPSITKLFLLMSPSEKAMIFISFILVIGSEAANLLTPLIVANAYDILVDPTISDDAERMSSINYYMIIAIVVTIAGIIAGFLRVTIQGVVGERVVARLRCMLYSKILKQGEMFDYHGSLVAQAITSCIISCDFQRLHSLMNTKVVSWFLDWEVIQPCCNQLYHKAYPTFSRN